MQNTCNKCIGDVKLVIENPAMTDSKTQFRND